MAEMIPRVGRDWIVAAIVLVVVATGSLRSLTDARDPWPITVLDWTLIGAACAALGVVRRRPVAVAAFVLAATAAYYLTSTADGPLLIALVVALFWVAAEGRLDWAIALTLVTLLLTAAGTLRGNGDVNRVALFMMTGWLVAVVAIGWLKHSRQGYGRERELRAATEERLRIARELHDVVGHHLSLINVQSTAALRRMSRHPEDAARAEEALGAVREASGEALRELRAMLGMLREQGEAAPTAPAPGLGGIGDLVQAARRAGLDVTARVDEGDEPPTEIGLAAYRIVQESLTNVTRHAAARRVEIRIGRAADALTVEVADDGRGGPADPSGSGIRGMRERAHALGGELRAGPGPRGGFAVLARLPHRNGASR
ncbi:sensor histidine kinase [Actinocorallia sp. A-T 12471]|uniref:sensor histidine kinase n=1 Tax=Actinocorallia sp. A-T 12471 TaxID=3089813 RepID=UPI0029CE17BF|nr:sensor histidine kinase [Actinocorallia sp. A-T 12471]MDX6742196.1 sensor histidine kinase [Actinocorallia sp. A-T 12471]